MRKEKKELKKYNRRLSREEAVYLGLKFREKSTYNYKGNPQYDLTSSQVDKLEAFKVLNEKPREVKLEETEIFLKAKTKKHDSRKKNFIFTWAQNATPVHANFLKNLLSKAKEHSAGLHVIAGRYKNPTSIYTEMDLKQEYWDNKVTPYLDANRHRIHGYLQVLSDVNIVPTTQNPLNGLESFTALESCIVGHPRMHLKFLPVLPSYPKKQIISTGACTIPNYTRSGAGAKGEFHHNLGFVIVQFEGDYFHARQVTADSDGNFYDLDKHYVDGSISKHKLGCDSIFLGDLHLLQMDEVAERESFKLINKLKPDFVIASDIFDGKSISPHATNFEKLLLEESGIYSLENEIQNMLDWIKKRAIGKPYKMVVQSANHNDWIDRWLDSNNWHNNSNKMAFLKYANMKAQLMKEKRKEYKGMIAHIIDNEFKGEVITLGRNDSFLINNVEHSLHGDKGANGSRGSISQFKKLNVKNTSGHTHSAARSDGSFVVGSLTVEDMGYDKGLSSRSQSNVIQFRDGKRQHVHLVSGKFYK